MDIEARFGCGVASSDPCTAGEHVGLDARLRSDKLSDDVMLAVIGPMGCVCERAPYADEGDMVEIAIDEADQGASYRFKARVQWLRDDVNDDFVLGLVFVGVPVLIRYGNAGDVTGEIMDRMAA